MSTLLPSITKTIQEACPELMELSFGCKLEDERVEELRYVGHSNRQHAVNAKMKDGTEALLFVDNFFTSTILGHDIQLQHVLRAIPNKSIAINGAGFFIEDVDGKPLVNLNVCYDLAQPFTNQSDSFYSWLANVLGVV